MVTAIIFFTYAGLLELILHHESRILVVLAYGFPLISMQEISRKSLKKKNIHRQYRCPTGSDSTHYLSTEARTD